MKSITPYLPASIACAFVALMAGQRHGGVVLVFIVPILLLGLLLGGFSALRRPWKRKAFAIKAGLWVLTIGVVSALQWHYYSASRQAADAVVASVLQYQQERGVPPATAEELGFVNGKNEWRIFYTLRDGNVPALLYLSTFMPFETWDYDFQTRQWVYRVH